ncbi:MAG: GYF domain-containing protein, partial [Polyangiaceae bacterium]
MSGDAEWRWADPRGQQRLVRLDELRAALVDGVIPPNAPVWRRGWKDWIAASDVPELMSQAIAAANGIVPNIPPPPLFIVAVQSEFESHTPDSRRDQTPYEEPPPPPPYVPVATPSSQPNLPGAGSPPVPATSSSPRTHDSASRLKTAKKQTMLGMPAASPQPAPAITASAQTGSSGSDQLKRALPQDAPPSSRFGADGGSKPLQNLPTVVGVPAIADPRTNAKASPRIETPFYGAARTEEKKSDRPPARTPSVKPPPLEPMLKRPTLILYGGAPQEEEERASTAPNAPPIVATAPGAPAGKNAVTQAPPWDKGAVELGPEIPKNARTPRMPSESADEISESLFIEATDAGPKIAGRSQPPPGPKKSSIPPPFRPKSLPPPMPGQASGHGPGPGMHVISDKGRTGRPPPFVPNHTPSFTIGDPNAAAPQVPYFEPDPATTNQLPAAPDADATSEYRPPPSSPPAGQSFLVYLNPLITKFPKLAPTRDKLAKFEEGKSKYILLAVAGLTTFVGMIFFIVIVKSIFGAIFGHGDETTTSTRPDASSSSSAISSASGAPANSNAIVTPPPPPTTNAVAAARPPCAVIGNPKMIASKALVPTGVEVIAATNSILVGFASGPKDGAVLAINPGNLAITSQTKTKSSDVLKRVEPLPADGRPQVSPNTDKKGDPLAGRRTVPSSPAYDLGVANGALAWALRGTDKINSLWPLNGTGAVEALRGVALDGGGGIAVAYRRSGAIWFGVATGDKSLSAGNLSSTQGLGSQVGSPAIASSGNSILAIWADRASASDAWGLRWQRWKIGDAPTAAEELTPPAGGPGAPFMSPGVASLGGGRFLVVWTEGSGQGHQVRALTIGADGQAQGLPMTISADGENAGQGQAAVTADGRGVVAYLVSAGAKNFQVSATS